MNDVFLFPGQGSEGPGMGRAALHRPGPVRSLLERASSALQLDLVRILVRGDPLLARTEIGQPALVALTLGMALELEAGGLRAQAVAGHSVGEVAAFACAGCLAPEEAVDCTVERARLMATAARRTPGSMIALRVTSEREVEAALSAGNEAGWLKLAAHNGPAEWVLTGDRTALAAVARRFPTTTLPVSGPWHSPAMADAADLWRERLRSVEWRRPSRLLVCNATGGPVTEDDDLVQLLVGQLTGPVRWAESLATLAGVARTWHLLGPARVLRGLCRANLGPEAALVLHDGCVDAELRP